ncbi:M48 family metallopeptidase [Sansalvadorimonas verongulae]|uniref:M48 family metallopeptidase n=1 Tax=Sansalvadorimonas verongulae TaxID=2172824 RepID=UPI0012BB8CCE|nr:M48 family metallopeptidase [Sansalvadorimonas verongulae]MTI12543.1 peptidase M48 Ste24p [Sansalvadorimonas verongulae]
MNFFQWQSDARRKTGLLIVLMALAVFSLVVMSNLLYVAFQAYKSPDTPWTQFLTLRSFLVSFVVIGSVVLTASVIKTFMLASGGGRAVARSLGGHPVEPGTDKFYERRLLNVVEEMSLASGMPVPAVYVLHGETGINAFAAGYSFNDAVIGVTKGTMELLSREELEGVIAHELSHIVHGDMRLNMRLVGIVFGITMLAEMGYFMMRSAGHSRSKDSGPVVMGGLGLMVIGYSGAFFGNMIKASISRTREFLADASAVQYTRNREGLATALQKVGGFAHGSLLESPKAQEASHMMFGQAVSSAMSGMFSTHPPLEERIRKLDPQWDGTFVTPEPIEADAANEQKQAGAVSETISGLAAGAAVVSHSLNAIGKPAAAHRRQAAALLDKLPVRLVDACRKREDFPAIAMALIVSEEGEAFDRQLEILNKHFDQTVVARTLAFHEDLAKCGVEDQLPVLELALSHIADMTLEQHTTLMRVLYAMSRADGKTSPLEWSLITIISHYCDKVSEKVALSRPFHSLQPVREEAVLVISALISMSGMNREQRITCFEQVTATFNFMDVRLQGQISYKHLQTALKQLNRLCPEAKQELLAALCTCVEFDGQVVAEEAQALRAMALVMECPMPPILSPSQ